MYFEKNVYCLDLKHKNVFQNQCCVSQVPQKDMDYFIFNLSR